MPPGRLSSPRLSTCLPQSSHDSANFNNNELENNQVVAKIANLNLSRMPPQTDNHAIPCCQNRRQRSQAMPTILDTELHFHPTRGADITLSPDRTVAYTNWQESNRTIVFTERPVHNGETLFVETGQLPLPYYGSLSFGITSCDPSTLRTYDLPSNPEYLLDRKEYWVVHQGLFTMGNGDIHSFSFTPIGEVHHGINGNSRGMLMCVDSSQPLWVFFSIHGIVNQLRIMGTVQSNVLSPSGSPSGSQYDSDSDMAFSVNRSSSASESSLVTAPSSPLSPPVSPVFAPEPQGSKDGECAVCFDNEVETVIYTCGHMCLCSSCGIKLKRQVNACCPICRRVIKDVIKTYRP